MDPLLYELLEKARGIKMTQAQRDEQRIGFAFGNAHIENPQITREAVRRALQVLNAENGDVKATPPD